ncbi:hypothetical protein JCM1841_002241 [Sporobolomyces salmonicolor]
MPLLVLSGADVSSLTSSLSAASLCSMLAKTMSAISRPPDPHGAVPPIQNPQRIATESELYRTLYMPSRLTTAQEGPATAIKVVSVPKPNCSVPGLPATTIVVDEATGLTRAVVNAAELTGLRTAAASALATKLLADPASQNLVVFGSGVQAYYHCRLILELFPSIRTATCVIRDLASPRSRLLFERLRPQFPSVDIGCALNGTAMHSDAVKMADILCTCVPSTDALFDADDLKPNVHINAIGSYTPSMREFAPSLVSPSTAPPSVRIPTILVDSSPACLAEAGELIAAEISPSDVIEIGSLLDGGGELKDDGETKTNLERLRQSGRSLFKCVGVGGMDVGITRLVIEEAERRGVGTKVPF